MFFKESRREFLDDNRIFTALKDGFEFTITQIHNSTNKNNRKYYVVVEDYKTDKSFNSLWKKISFETLDGAKKWCEDVFDFYKEKRIQESTKFDTGHLNANNRLEEFFQTEFSKTNFFNEHEMVYNPTVEELDEFLGKEYSALKYGGKVLKINIAGTGSFLGKGIVLAQKINNGEVEKVLVSKFKENNREGISREIIETIKMLDVSKKTNLFFDLHKPIFIKVSNELRREGYEKISNKKNLKNRQKAHKLYMESLYDLGVRRTVKLKDEDYKQFTLDLFYEVARNPKLKKYIKKDMKSQELMDNLYKVENFVIDLLEERK